MTQVLIASTVLLSMVIGLQWIGLDPFGWLSLRAESFPARKMSLYGTLGNPNFVAACPLFLTVRSEIGAESRFLRMGRDYLWILPCGALLLTGSKIFLLTLPFLGWSFAGIGRWTRWKKGLVPLMMLVLWKGFQTRKAEEALCLYRRAAAMGIVILAITALFDFPLHRPAEWGLFWILMALAV